MAPEPGCCPAGLCEPSAPRLFNCIYNSELICSVIGFLQVTLEIIGFTGSVFCLQPAVTDTHGAFTHLPLTPHAEASGAPSQGFQRVTKLVDPPAGSRPSATASCPPALADPTRGLRGRPGPPRCAASLPRLSQGIWSAGLGGPSASDPTFAHLAEPGALACDPGKKHGHRPRAHDRAAPGLGLSHLPPSTGPHPFPSPGPCLHTQARHRPQLPPTPSTRPPPPHPAFTHPAWTCPRGP